MQRHLQKKCYSFPKTVGSIRSNYCEPCPGFLSVSFFEAGCNLASLSRSALHGLVQVKTIAVFYAYAVTFLSNIHYVVVINWKKTLHSVTY